jgi:hypothetical protein
MAARPAAAAAQQSAWGSGMLGTVATTAMGVVAGSMLFQGIQSMMGQDASSAGDTATDHSNALTDAGQQVAQQVDNGAIDYDGDFDGDFDLDGFA